ncbi:hypothetical protein TIFTF001_022314 [Ficus carica]|uniref:Uncharacterized protein n=1 Tax=Ficus carica TaxID=3494 RepID=A0AA88DFE8_FICCA|nr:hypothetical protein TIFTF001_022314 [Ficus carica]
MPATYSRRRRLTSGPPPQAGGGGAPGWGPAGEGRERKGKVVGGRLAGRGWDRWWGAGGESPASGVGRRRSLSAVKRTPTTEKIWVGGIV